MNFGNIKTLLLCAISLIGCSLNAAWRLPSALHTEEDKLKIEQERSRNVETQEQEARQLSFEEKLSASLEKGRSSAVRESEEKMEKPARVEEVDPAVEASRRFEERFPYKSDRDAMSSADRRKQMDIILDEVKKERATTSERIAQLATKQSPQAGMLAKAVQPTKNKPTEATSTEEKSMISKSRTEVMQQTEKQKLSKSQRLSNWINKRITSATDKLSRFEDRMRNASTVEQKQAAVNELKSEEVKLAVSEKQTEKPEEKKEIHSKRQELRAEILGAERKDPDLNQAAKAQSLEQIEKLKAELAARKQESAEDKASIEAESIGSGRLTEDQVRGSLAARYKSLIALEEDEGKKAAYEKELKAIQADMKRPLPIPQGTAFVIEK